MHHSEAKRHEARDYAFLDGIHEEGRMGIVEAAQEHVLLSHTWER